MNKEVVYTDVMDCAFAVHRELGPGLLENIYKQCMAFEIRELGYRVEVEKRLPVVYKGRDMDFGYRIDLLVEDTIVVELKTVDRLTDLHFAQTLTYMKLANKDLGMLLNFNRVRLKDGFRRIVN